MAPDISTPSPDGAGWLRLLEGRGAAPARDAVTSALASAVSQPSTLSARLAFAKLGRGIRPVALTGDDLGVPEASRGAYLLEDVVARIAFLVGLSEHLPTATFDEVLTTLYRTGSDREQMAVLRALPCLPGPERFVHLAREASRTNDVVVFSALACDSVFPARYLPDSAFEQLILKALFVGVPLDRVLFLSTRVTPELKRMVADFAAERRAAGRPVPTDVPALLDQNEPPT